MSWVCLNDQIVSEDQAFIPINDRGLLFGDGIFTTCRVENGEVVHWASHCERLNSHCRFLNITPPKITIDLVDKLIERNQASQGVWKLKIVITGGNDPTLALPLRRHGSIFMTLKPYQTPEGYVKVCVYPHPVELPLSRMKSLSYLHRLMVKQYAVEQGADDAIVCSAGGWVMEGAFSNLFWKENGDYITPDLSLPLLPGTYLSTLPNLHEEKLTYEELCQKEDVYLCNSMCERPCLFV